MMCWIGEYSYVKLHSEQEKDWQAYPHDMDVCHFYGGDLQGIMHKLDYLQDLGIEVLYLNPIFFHHPIINMTFRIMIILIHILAELLMMQEKYWRKRYGQLSCQPLYPSCNQ